MPVVVMYNSKGGSGKSTASLAIASALAEHNATVTLIEADSNSPQGYFFYRGGPNAKELVPNPDVPPTLSLFSGVTEHDILEKIEEAKASSKFVIVDIEGSKNLVAVFAIAEADLVLIPTQGSVLDARESYKAVKLVQAAEKSSRRKLDYRILFTRTPPDIEIKGSDGEHARSPFRSKNLKDIEKSFAEKGIRVLRAEVHERPAYAAMYAYNAPLSKFPAHESGKGLERAKEESLRIVREILTILREQRDAASERGGSQTSAMEAAE
jgi:chromosome partitioning protein